MSFLPYWTIVWKCLFWNRTTCWWLREPSYLWDLRFYVYFWELGKKIDIIFLPISCCSELQSSWCKHNFDGVVSNIFPNVHCVTVFLGHLMGKKKLFVPVSLKAVIRVHSEFWRKNVKTFIIQWHHMSAATLNTVVS